MKNEELEEIVALLEKGFNPQIISFELDIPEDIINICEKILNNRKINMKSKNNKEVSADKRYEIESSVNKSKSNDEQYIIKFEEIRKRYNDFFCYEIKKTKIIQTIEEEKFINTIIERMEKNFNSYNYNSNREEKVKFTNEILNDIKKLYNYNFTIEQSNRIIEILFSKKMHIKKRDINDRYHYRLEDARSKIRKKVIDSYLWKIEDLNDIDKLKELMNEVSCNINSNGAIIEKIKFHINNKITKLREKNAINKYKQDLPILIMKVTQSVCSNQFNLEESKKLIEQYILEKEKSSQKSFVHNTPEQEYDKAIMKVRSVLVNNAELFEIDNPGSTIENLIKLQKGKVENTVSTVARHFLAKKDYKKAMIICNTYQKKHDTDNSFLANYGISLRREINNEEIKDFVLFNLNENKTPEEINMFFYTLDRKLEEKGLKMSSIIIARKDSKILTLDQLIYGKKVSKDRTIH